MTASMEEIKIVVADDNPGIRSGLQTDILKSYPKASVRTFSDAISTQVYLVENPFETDVLFLDVDFGPGSTGLDVLEDIRESDRNLTIVLLTGTTIWDDLAAACRVYDVAYLPKPVPSERLRISIESALARLESLSQLRGTIDSLQAALAEASRVKPGPQGAAEIADSEILRGLFPRLDFSKAAVAEMIKCKDIRLMKALSDLNNRTPGNGSYLKQIKGTPGLWEARFSTPGRVFLRFHDNRVLIENIDPNHRVLA